jgi:hypothetical protein
MVGFQQNVIYQVIFDTPVKIDQKLLAKIKRTPSPSQIVEQLTSILPDYAA